MTDTCVVCRSRPATVRLLPCDHKELCRDCCIQLPDTHCPICRRRCSHAIFPLKSGPKTVDFIDLLKKKKQKDEDIHSKTVQVVITGPQNVGKARLTNRIISKFPCRHQVDSVVITDDVDGEHLNTRSRFQANSTVGGVDVCFRTFDLPQLDNVEPVAIRHLLWNLKDLRPDVLVLACSMHLLRTFKEMVGWDSNIRTFYRSRGEKVPQRTWILVRAPGFDPLSPSAVDLRTDIYEGMLNISIADRPSRHFVVSPNSWIPRAVGKLAKHSAHSGAKERCIAIPPKSPIHRLFRRINNNKVSPAHNIGR